MRLPKTLRGHPDGEEQRNTTDEQNDGKGRAPPTPMHPQPMRAATSVPASTPSLLLRVSQRMADRRNCLALTRTPFTFSLAFISGCKKRVWVEGRETHTTI